MMRARALLAGALVIFLWLSPLPCAQAHSGTNSLLEMLGDPQKKEELHSWLQHATIDELCVQLGESFRSLAPDFASSPDQEFAWPRLLNLLAAAMNGEHTHALSDPRAAAQLLTARLQQDPYDVGAWALLVGCLRQLPAEDTPRTVVGGLRSIPSTFLQPGRDRREDLFRMQCMEEALTRLARQGVTIEELESAWMQAMASLFRDAARDPEVRGNALDIAIRRGARDLGGEVRNLLEAPEMAGNSPLRTRAVRAIAQLEGPSSLPLLRSIARDTQDEAAFTAVGPAAASIGGVEALHLLVDANHRFGGNLFGMYIARADTLILESLESSDLDECAWALGALDHVRSPNHPHATPHRHRDFLPLLLSFATDATHRPLRAEILRALLTRTTREEAAALLEQIPREPDIAREWDLLRHVRDRVAAPSLPSEVSPPERAVRGNHEGREYGDPGYKKLGFFGEWPLLEDFGHTGIYSGLSAGAYGTSIPRIIEVGTFLGDHVVQSNEWEPMECAEPDCWGAYTLDNAELQFEDRVAIVQTARDLQGENISYPLDLPPDVSDALNAIPGGGPTVEPGEIERLRCDGLIEYCYELNGFSVWGPYGTSCDISRYDWIVAHNDLYVPGSGDPNTELAPVVQCGRAGGVATHLRVPANVSFPAYEVAYSVQTLAPQVHQVTLTIAASDESG
ncbi:MAG TPA: HEAT repeat domain-containing protein, partial [bacterium]|nr:HEAT repeat domain-containing protein [bacterium]